MMPPPAAYVGAPQPAAATGSMNINSGFGYLGNHPSEIEVAPNITQSLQNIQRLFQNSNDPSTNPTTNDSLMVQVTQVSMNDLPLTFDQINHAIIQCANSITGGMNQQQQQ